MGVSPTIAAIWVAFFSGRQRCLGRKHELYWERSPIAHITDVETPMLLTHGKCGTTHSRRC